MTDKHLFVLAAAVSLCTLISLIWRPENKSLLWRYTMFGSFALFALTAMLAWLNQYAKTDLYPFYWFGYTTLGMVALGAVTYFMNLRGPVEVPDEIVDQLSQQTDSATLIERYRQGLVADQQRRIRVGSWVAGAGIAFIGVAFAVIHSFGLAEDINGQQESFSKVIVRLVGEVRLLRDELHTVGDKLDSTRRDVRTNGNRITKLEKRNTAVDKRDSINAAILKRGQRAIRQEVKRVKSSPSYQMIQPKRKWWEIGERTRNDSLSVARHYE